jgi:hypothetical protein
MKMKLALVAAMLALVAISVVAAQEGDPPPGSIKLLPGYRHKTEQGIDTAVGRIWKEGGLTITYDIGRLAGHYAGPDAHADFLWRKEQMLGEQVVWCALTKEGQLIITFAKTSANFFAKVKTQEDIAEVLLMILSYQEKRPPS